MPSLTQTARRKPYQRNGVKVDRLPPYSPEAEQGVLGCIMLSPNECMKDCASLSAEAFYDLRNAEIFLALKRMFSAKTVIDVITLQQYLKDKKLLAQCGGISYLASLPDAVPSAANLSYYLDIIKEKYALRKMIHVCTDAVGRVYEYEGEVDGLMQGVLADLDTVARLGIKEERPRLKIWKSSELLAYERPAHLDLVGDNEIFMGYEGVVVFAGPGSSGKSLCTVSLALAGALGSGYWMGRKVHRQFKTLILQAENGKGRLQRMVKTMAELHPQIDVEGHVFFSEPPEGGLPFESADFRTAVREEVDRLKPDLVILDPWSHVGCEDSADAIKEKLTQIRSCFPYGDQCPCLLIVAHTKKPRSEDVRKGRGLMYMVSGSINLVNTARCCYVMLPWTEDLEDKRVYFATPKLNDGENYAPSVWIRKAGTFFEHDDKTNPKEFGKTGDEEDGRAISEEDLRNAFDNKPELKAGELVAKIVKITGCGTSTAWRAISEDAEQGYLRKFMQRSAHGKLKLKEAK